VRLRGAGLYAGAAAALLAASCAAGPARAVHPAAPAVPTLQSDIDAILNDPALARGTWGVVVASLKSGERLYARNAEKLLMPASNMKIVTLAAAADALGWDYRYETRLYTAGRIENGTLAGDLVVVGSGDPSLGTLDGSADAVFGEWADRLRQLGIRTIAGRLVGDDTAFEPQTLGFGWSWDDLPDDYAAGVGALQFNENAVRVLVAPGPRPGDQAAISAEPAESGVEIVGLATTGNGPTSLSARRLPGSQRLEVGGTIAAGAAPSVLTVAVDNPTLFFVRSLRRALIARGIDVRGPAVDIDDAGERPRTNPAEPIIVHRSPPLSTLAVRLMKASQNQYAETFLKTIGRPQGSPASASAGRAAAQQIFDRWGVHAGDLIQRDGSGLSRYDYVTADAIVRILAHVYADPKLRAPFEASLPIAGRDGSLASRMKGTAAEGNARAKTGSMSNVRGLSGYVSAADGEPLAFSILANNFETAADVINKAADAIVVRLANERRTAAQRSQP
jgi:D-alanyl-D-alanine carboxypeptidase/D-alanyl-D-alanine-endopeptidase (penicillin-binding protein 4)